MYSCNMRASQGTGCAQRLDNGAGAGVQLAEEKLVEGMEFLNGQRELAHVDVIGLNVCGDEVLAVRVIVAEALCDGELEQHVANEMRAHDEAAQPRAVQHAELEEDGVWYLQHDAALTLGKGLAAAVHMLDVR